MRVRIWGARSHRPVARDRATRESHLPGAPRILGHVYLRASKPDFTTTTRVLRVRMG